MLQRKTSADYHALAEQREFQWLGPEVSNIQTKTGWQCSKGHRWEAPYTNICHQGSGCPTCGGNLPKTSADYHALAQERGFCWLGPLPSNTCAKTWWQCGEGHQWEARYNDIQQGTSCPVYQKRVPITAEQYHAAGVTIGIHWTGKNVPKNTGIPTSWECDGGHR